MSLFLLYASVLSLPVAAPAFLMLGTMVGLMLLRLLLVGGWLRGFVVIEARIFLELVPFGGKAFEFFQIVDFIPPHECNCVTGCACAARPADAVDVILRERRDIIIDHMRDAFHVDTFDLYAARAKHGFTVQAAADRSSEAVSPDGERGA